MKESNIKSKLKEYIFEKVKELDTKEEIKLENVYPSLLEETLGVPVKPYDLNGYDADYSFITDKYSIDGSMKYGTADIRLINKNNIALNKEEEIKVEDYFIDKVPNNIDLNNGYEIFYFTFGMGQAKQGFCQPIVAKSFKLAHKLMLKIYGTNWSMNYTEAEWKLNSCKEKELTRLYAIEELMA